MKSKQAITAFAVFSTLSLAASAAEVKYELQVQRTWSQATHPVDWPGDAAHFSPGIGVAHSAHYKLFGEGAIATAGLETLSQRGRTSPFDEEIAEAKRRGLAAAAFALEPVKAVNGTTKTIVVADDDHPLLSFASMVAPSPDWFTGLANYSLKRNGQWIESDTIALYAWDSGTNAAASYKAAKVAQKAFTPVTPSLAAPFVKEGKAVPVATLTIRKVN